MILFCKYCGKSFETERRKKYCCVHCSIRHYQESIHPARETRCEICETPFITGGPGGRGSSRYYCSSPCRLKGHGNKKRIRPKDQIPLRKCKQCHIEFKPSAGGYKYCSNECKLRWWNENKKEVWKKSREALKINPKHILTCKICGNIFFHNNSKRLCCSKNCWRKSLKNVKLDPPVGYSYCSKCLRLFPIENFRFIKSLNRLESQCKRCRFSEKYKFKRNLREAIKRKIDPKFRIDNTMKAGIHKSLRNGNGKNGRRWELLVNYKLEDLIRHLEKKFKHRMTFDNYGHGKGKWTIDHIIPRSIFNYRNTQDLDFQKCWELKNLQPMWYSDNIRKGNHLNKPFQPNFRWS